MNTHKEKIDQILSNFNALVSSHECLRNLLQAWCDYYDNGNDVPLIDEETYETPVERSVVNGILHTLIILIKRYLTEEILSELKDAYDYIDHTDYWMHKNEEFVNEQSEIAPFNTVKCSRYAMKNFVKLVPYATPPNYLERYMINFV